MTTKLLVITGASKGIGLATAKLMQQQGWQVVNISRTAIPLEGATQICADLSSERWAVEISEELCAIAACADQIALVHCSALLAKDTTKNLSAAALRDVMEVNVIAPLQLNQLLLPHMKPGSSILYIGSTLSEKAVAGACSYVTSKHATVGLMRATCQDLAGSGIHTVCICPGFTETEMLRAHVGNDDDILASIASGVTQGRLIQPAEMARVIAFCADNPVMNGEVLHANLGQIES